MTTTTYYTATSIDGYIADQRHSLDWLFEVEQPGDDGFAAFFATIGAFAMGSSTYEWILAHEKVAQQPDRWLDWYGDIPCWVFTHRSLPLVPGAAVTFASGDVRPVHDQMVAAAGRKDIWLVGGGELVATFADHGLLDQIVLTVAPATLGGGAPLLPRRLTSSRLSLASVARTGQFATLTYTVRPSPDR